MPKVTHNKLLDKNASPVGLAIRFPYYAAAKLAQKQAKRSGPIPMKGGKHLPTPNAIVSAWMKGRIAGDYALTTGSGGAVQFLAFEVESDATKVIKELNGRKLSKIVPPYKRLFEATIDGNGQFKMAKALGLI